MTWLEAVILALVQGFTEFLPISSSAHLILPSQILGWSDQGLAFDVAVHVGTLLAIVIYFRREVVQLTGAWFKSVSGREQSQNSRLAWLIILSTIPAGLSGFLFNDFISDNLRSTAVIATTTILFGVILYISDHRGRSPKFARRRYEHQGGDHYWLEPGFGFDSGNFSLRDHHDCCFASRLYPRRGCALFVFAINPFDRCSGYVEGKRALGDRVR